MTDEEDDEGLGRAQFPRLVVGPNGEVMAGEGAAPPPVGVGLVDPMAWEYFDVDEDEAGTSAAPLALLLLA